ncbi:MAG: hypothetical protein AAGG68_05945 [Bacteroidota bacterium]
MKRLIFLSLILFSSSLLYGQGDWKAGFISRLESDTLSGWIELQKDQKYNQFCKFKNSEESATTMYFANDLYGFGIENGKFYVAKTIEVEEAQKAVFVESLFEGILNLYHYNGKAENFYLIEKEEELFYLRNTTEASKAGDQGVRQKRKEYLGILKYLLQGTSLEREISRTSYNHRKLTQLMEKYQEAIAPNDPYIIHNKSLKPKLDIGFSAGINHQTLQLTSPITFETNDESSRYAGIALNLKNIPFLYERFSLQTEVWIQEYYLLNEEEKSRFWHIPVFIDYRILAGKFSPRLELGFSNQIVRNESFNTRNQTLMAGVSLHYNYLKDYRAVLHVRAENKPRIIKIGGSLMF